MHKSELTDIIGLGYIVSHKKTTEEKCDKCFTQKKPSQRGEVSPIFS